MREKWLVTGAAGFIGSNIIKYLIENDQIVFALDDFSNGDYENIKKYEKYTNNFIFYEGDIRIYKTCHYLCDQVDYVLHQAALASVPRSIETPGVVHDVNVTGFLNMLIAAKEANVKKFVYASSSSVYGDDETLLKVENIIGNPLSPYGATKKINEVYAAAFTNTYGVDTIGLRYFNVYGPNQKFEGPYVTVIPTWCRAFIKDEEVYIFGDGKTSRDFCYVEDVVEANILAAKSDLKGTHIFNVGAAESTSLNKLFMLIKGRFNKPEIEPMYRDFRAGDARHTLADLTSIEEHLGYEIKYDIHTGLDKAIEWYRKKFDNFIGG